MGIGGTALAVQALFGSLAAVTAPFGVPRLGDAFGTYGGLSIFVLMMPFVVWGMWVLLRRTRFGLRLAAAGEHPLAARSVGTNPARARLIALAAGGVLCAIGGAELAAGGLHIFAQNMTAGRGFMSFAAVIFGASHPLGAAFAAIFFSLVGVAGIRLQLLFGGEHSPRRAAFAALSRDDPRRLGQRADAGRREGRNGSLRASRLLEHFSFRRTRHRSSRAYPVVTDTHQIWGRERLHTSRKHTTYGGCLC